MPCVSLFGVPVAWSCEGIAADPIASLLAVMEPAVWSGEGEARIRIEARPACDRTADNPREEGYRPSFFQGVVQAYLEAPPRAPAASGSTEPASAFLLWDRASRVRVPLDGSPLEAEIASADKEIAPGSTAGMLQIALALALRREGLFHLHAAAAVHPSGAGVLIVGGSGAGKTTTTLALLEAGYDYLGDDALFLRARDAVHARDALLGQDAVHARGADPTDAADIEVLAFPREFHLGAATLAAFPRLQSLACARPSPLTKDKRALDPRPAFPGRHRPGMLAPSRILVPLVTDAATTDLAPLTKADGFGALLASSAALLIDGAPRRNENLTLLRRLLATATCLELRLGRDVLADPASSIAPRVDAALPAASNAAHPAGFPAAFPSGSTPGCRES